MSQGRHQHDVYFQPQHVESPLSFFSAVEAVCSVLMSKSMDIVNRINLSAFKIMIIFRPYCWEVGQRVGNCVIHY